MWIIAFFLILVSNSQITKFKEFQAHLNEDSTNSIILSVCFNDDGTKLITAGKDGFVKIWDTQTGTLNHSINLFDTNAGQYPTHVSWQPSTNKIIVLTIKGQMLVYDPSKNYQKTVTRKLIDPLLTSVPSDASDYANTISWITSNSTLAVSAWNNNPANPPVIEFHISGNGLFGNLTGKAITTDFPAGTSISDLSISPDATKILAVSFKRNQVKMFQLNTNTTLQTFSLTVPAICAEFNPHYDEIYIGLQNQTMSVYKKDAATNQYTFAYSIDFTSSTGHPYALTGAIKDKIVVASGNKVFVYNRTQSQPVLDSQGCSIRHIKILGFYQIVTKIIIH